MAELVREIRIEAAPETVFALLTEPGGMQSWVADAVEAEARPGGLLRLANAAGATVEGRYVEVVAGRRVVFTWGGIEGVAPGQSTVEIELVPDGAATLLKLRHYDLPDAAVENHARVWQQSGLPKLRDAAMGRPLDSRCL